MLSVEQVIVLRWIASQISELHSPTEYLPNAKDLYVGKTNENEGVKKYTLSPKKRK